MEENHSGYGVKEDLSFAPISIFIDLQESCNISQIIPILQRIPKELQEDSFWDDLEGFCSRLDSNPPPHSELIIEQHEEQIMEVLVLPPCHVQVQEQTNMNFQPLEG